MSLRQLFPHRTDAPDLAAADLAALYGYPGGPGGPGGPDGRWLRANMVSSADGAASLQGASAGLSCDTDRQVFALLRALSDVILVGAATARAEHYKPARTLQPWRGLRAGRTPTPPIAVVTRRLDLDPDSPLVAAAPPHARTIVITTAGSPAARRAELARHADIIVAGEETVDLKAAVGALAGRGHRRLLTEGGPHLLAQLAGAGLLDELCLTIGPLMAGPGVDRIVAGAPVAGPAAPLPLTLAHVLEDDGFLLCRYTRKELPRTNRARAPPGSRAGQQAALEAGRHRGGAVVDTELGVDVQHVGLDRGLADEQAGGGLRFEQPCAISPRMSSSRWLSGSLAGCLAST